MKLEVKWEYSLGGADMCIAKRARRYPWHKGEKINDFPDVQPSESIMFDIKFAHTAF